jgi:hypothetical protein
MEDHFHAAVLLGLERLIEIGAVSEISTAVGDEEGGVDLLFLDELRAESAQVVSRVRSSGGS